MKICGRDIKMQGRLIRVASPELDKYEPLNDPETIVDALHKSAVRFDLFTFMEIVPETAPRYPYHTEWGKLAVLPVSTFDYWWTHQLRSLGRNRARQAAKKGVVLREVPFEDTLARGIWEVYNESPVRQRKRNVHYGKDVDLVRREAATFLDRSVFIGAFFGEQLIGFAKLVTDTRRTHANLMNIVAMTKHRDKAPTNALIGQAVQSCAEHGIRYLTYQNFTYGRKKPDTLTNFKQVNGFQRVDLPRYYVPLTAVGRVALRLGLHHRLVDQLPQPVMDGLRELRSAWYERRFQSTE